MTASIDGGPIAGGRFRFAAAVFAAILLTAGMSAIVLVSNTSPASASTVSFSQCNGHAADPLGAAITETCSIDVVNTIDSTGNTSSVVTSRVCTLGGCTGDITSPSNVINAVHQCNFSNIEGGSTTICSVNIVNNISASAPGAPTAVTVNQCIGSGTGGGTNMTACNARSEGSPSVTQCNRSGTGGGGMMTCTASGTTSAAFPVFVDQCNDSETGGGSFVTCTTTITTNVFDTDTGTSVPVGGPPAGPPTGTDTGGGVPESPGLPGSPPFVVLPPNFTG